MRISDWSSDVCSSDLDAVHHDIGALAALACRHIVIEQRQLDILAHRQFIDQVEALEDEAYRGIADHGGAALGQPVPDARRVVKEGVSTYRSWWTWQHYKKKTQKPRVIQATRTT